MTFGTFDPSVCYTERIAAYVVIRSPSGDVAAVRGRTAYFLPGGGREGDETSEQTVRREVREELERDLYLTGCVGEALQYFFAAQDNCHFKMRATFFTAEFADAEASQSENVLYWLPEETALPQFFHACHAWAVERSKPVL